MIWDSKKQKTVVKFSCEAEYMALTEGAKEAVFLQLEELEFYEFSNFTIFGGNMGALKLAKNLVFH